MATRSPQGDRQRSVRRRETTTQSVTRKRQLDGARLAIAIGIDRTNETQPQFETIAIDWLPPRNECMCGKERSRYEYFGNRSLDQHQTKLAAQMAWLMRATSISEPREKGGRPHKINITDQRVSRRDRVRVRERNRDMVTASNIECTAPTQVWACQNKWGYINRALARGK